MYHSFNAGLLLSYLLRLSKLASKSCILACSSEAFPLPLLAFAVHYVSVRHLNPHSYSIDLLPQSSYCRYPKTSYN